MAKKCPKCGTERQEKDSITPSYECPSCGIIYAKYEKILKQQNPLSEPDERETLPSKQNSESDTYIKCPFCHENIQKMAIKCKHCGEMLNGKFKNKLDTDIIGVLGLILPAGASAFGYFWISQMRLIDNPAEKLMLIAVGTIVATSLLFAIEASLLGIGSKEDKTGKSGPISWFLFCLLFWVAGYPFYLYWRSKYGRKNQLVGGILIAFVFIGTLGFMNYAIESAKTEVMNKIDNIKRTYSNGLSYSNETAEKIVVTMREYQNLHDDISYHEAVRIIGEEGEEVSRNKLDGIPGVMGSVETVMYRWQNSDGGNMNAMFQNDKLIQKAQFGLK